ncbi:MAG: Membrane protein insertase YidC [Verrucomicrobiae bacterium]|nr:Membrane protein insertase YidC [Verrucomicrobiae bacterium]
MDKRTIQVALICMLALFGVQFAINKIWPPVPKRPAPVVVTNAVPSVVADPAQPIEAPPAVETSAPTVAASERPTEQTLTLRNDFVRVEFTSWGGGIKSVELLKHKANGHGNATLAGLALVVNGTSNEVFTLEQPDSNTVVMRGAGMKKTLTLGADYLFDGKVEFGHGAGLSNVFISTGIATPTTHKEVAHYLIADWQGGPKWNDRHLSRIMKRTQAGENRELIQAHWIAVKSQYFAQIISTPTNAVSITYRAVGLPAWPDHPKSAETNGVTAVMEVPVAPTYDGAAVTFTYYAGPKDYDRLVALGKHQEEAMDYGSWLDFYSGIFGLLLFRGLSFFYGIIPSYGIAIILVTLVLKIVFWPIQAKSMASMKQMQKFQPQVAKLKEKYKDDPQRLNQETMKLYKEHKINPFAGCLPMLVQLPVLMAFYKVLISDIGTRGVPFLWIKDLAQPDTIFMVAGIGLNPLPIIMTGLMVWQQKITPQTGDPQQAKMMMFMPLIMLIFFYNTASGLTLYWTFQQLLSIVQQWWSMRKEQKAGTAPMAAKPK